MDVRASRATDAWLVPGDLRHERVVWLAARPELERIHRKWWHVLSRILGSADAAYCMNIAMHNLGTDDLAVSLRQASVIVDDLAGHFCSAERERVRRTGELPAWFWPVYRGAFDDATREVGAASLRR